MKIPWESVQNEALEILRELIRLDTSNPPGNERVAADLIAEALGRHGVESVIRESAPTRANLVARLAGSDRSKSPLMLSSHTDVVPVGATDGAPPRRRNSPGCGVAAIPTCSPGRWWFVLV